MPNRPAKAQSHTPRLPSEDGSSLSAEQSAWSRNARITEFVVPAVTAPETRKNNIENNYLETSTRSGKPEEKHSTHEGENVYSPIASGTGLLLSDTNTLNDATREQLLERLIVEVGISRIADFIIEKASLDESAHIVSMVGVRLANLVPAQTSLNSSSARPTRPALISYDQMAAIEARAVERPWRLRPKSLWKSSPYEWIQENYGEWVGKGLRLSHLAVDPSLYQALRTWRSHHPVPPELDLPVRPRRSKRSNTKLENN